jgi:hypothetical protein
MLLFRTGVLLFCLQTSLANWLVWARQMLVEGVSSHGCPAYSFIQQRGHSMQNMPCRFILDLKLLAKYMSYWVKPPNIRGKDTYQVNQDRAKKRGSARDRTGDLLGVNEMP